MKLKNLYFEVDKYIKLIDFNKLWPGFYPLKFALYNDKECFFDGNYIEKNDAFLGNTSINYNGEMIAIWNVMEEISPILLCSKMIHEMFHGFQNLNNECRWPDEMEAIYKYEYVAENLGIKLEENKLIVTLIDEFDLELFNKLLALRKYRFTKYNYQYSYESKIEQIEGCANFVELNVLKQLSEKLYLEKLNIMKKDIINSANLFPIRIISYDIGALLLSVLINNNIPINTRFNENTFLSELVLKTKYIEGFSYNSLEEEIQAYNLKSKQIIEKALLDNKVILDETNNLLGFNVYNARYYDNYIISRFFVMYGNIDNPTVKYGDFVILTKEARKIDKIYMI